MNMLVGLMEKGILPDAVIRRLMGEVLADGPDLPFVPGNPAGRLPSVGRAL